MSDTVAIAERLVLSATEVGDQVRIRGLEPRRRPSLGDGRGGRGAAPERRPRRPGRTAGTAGLADRVGWSRGHRSLSARARISRVGWMVGGACPGPLPAATPGARAPRSPGSRTGAQSSRRATWRSVARPRGATAPAGPRARGCSAAQVRSGPAASAMARGYLLFAQASLHVHRAKAKRQVEEHLGEAGGQRHHGVYRGDLGERIGAIQSAPAPRRVGELVGEGLGGPRHLHGTGGTWRRGAPRPERRRSHV